MFLFSRHSGLFESSNHLRILLVLQAVEHIFEGNYTESPIIYNGNKYKSGPTHKSPAGATQKKQILKLFAKPNQRPKQIPNECPNISKHALCLPKRIQRIINQLLESCYKPAPLADTSAQTQPLMMARDVRNRRSRNRSYPLAARFSPVEGTTDD